MKPNDIDAFPQTDQQGNCYTGMSLRDYFAGQYLQGHLSSEYYAGMNDSKENLIGIAKTAYKFADAMLEVRSL